MKGSPVRIRASALMIPSDVIELGGRRLVAAARQPARVLLFGSHARGDAGPASDLDFLVIERNVPNRHAEMVRLGREVASLGSRSMFSSSERRTPRSGVA